MKKFFLLCVVLVLLLVGCKNDTEDEVTTLTLASFGDNSELSEQVELFNQNHTDYKIEIKQYQRSEHIEEDGIAQLQKEIISGKGPDIINFGMDYSVTDIMGEYTENLYPYITETAMENDVNYYLIENGIL